MKMRGHKIIIAGRSYPLSALLYEVEEITEKGRKQIGEMMQIF